jgi:hypothetical protein
MIEGLDWQEIRRWFLQWTGSNFADSTTDDGFRVLLDEMVGLGILRVNDNCRYALRSPNVLSFMGNQDDIENGLLNVKHHSELAYEAADFRAALPADAHTGSKSHLRSPLTAEQTSSLVERKNAVSVLFGSAALGIDQVPTFLELAFDPRFVFHCSARDDAEFRTYLDELRHRNMENLCLGLIPSGCPWSVGWVESAVNRVGRLTSERAKVRLLFLADPAKTFAWAGLAPGRVNDLYRLGLTSMELRLWRNAAVEQWLRDCEFPHGEEDVQRLAAVSGNWPLLIEQLFEIARTEPRMEKSFELLAENVHNSKAAKALLTAIGFDDVSASRQVLSLIGTKSATAEEVRDVLDDPAQYPLKSIERVLCWAEKLQIVRPSSSPTGIQTWQVDAVVASLLTSLDITHA